MSYGPSRGSRGGGGRSSHPYSRGSDRRGDYEEEVIEISTNRLYVHNLSWRVSWQDLKDHFRQAGEVIHTKILTEGPGGRSKGCGIVEMDSVDSAANAVEMLNDTELQGRNILIREDREDNGGRDGGRYDDRRGPPARGGDRDTCNKCGGVGHWARDCPSVVGIGGASFPAYKGFGLLALSSIPTSALLTVSFLDSLRLLIIDATTPPKFRRRTTLPILESLFSYAHSATS